MAIGKVKRTPDAGVATAVQSVIQQQKFKRMVQFGLRSLSDFCSPSNQLYQENALEAMDRGVLAAIQTAVNTFSDDDDLLQVAARVIWAMSKAVKEEMDKQHISQLQKEAMPIAIIIVNASPGDAQTVEDTMEFFDNLNAAGVAVDGASIVPGLLAILAKANFQMKTAKRITGALAIAAQSLEGSTAILNAGGTAILLSFCLNKGDTTEAGVETVVGAFEAVRAMASHRCTDSSTLNDCIALMEKYSERKAAVSRGSAALAAMVGPEQLHQCLTTLKVEAADSPAYAEALRTLGSMSYISSFTEEIVKAGGIPLLVELMNSGLTQIAAAGSSAAESSSTQLFAMMAGAAKMLRRISDSSPAHVDAIVAVGGVATLCTAVSYCAENLECLGALSQALIPLVSRASLAHEIVEYMTFATILPTLYQHVENASVACDVIALVDAGSQHPEIRAHMLQHQAAEICALCCQYHTDNSAFQLHAIAALTRLAPQLSSLRGISDYGGIQGVTAALTANTQNESVALAAVQLMEAFSQVADARSFFTDGAAVDAVLAAMLEHEQCQPLIDAGIEALSRIAAEKDCSRHLNDLDASIQTARGDPERVHRVLAAIAGLSRISALRQVFEEKRASERILQGVSAWVECARFEGQERVIRAGLRTVKTLRMSGEGDLSETFIALCDIACLPQIKRLVELEQPDENVLVVASGALLQLASTLRFSAGNGQLTASVEAALKVMRKYPDSRRTQVNCIQTLNYLAQAEGGAGVGIIASQTGALPAVIQYMNKTPMYLDAQLAGFTLLVTCSKIDPSTVDIMRKCNCLQALKVAMRTHAKSKELKRTIAPLLALIMPTDALEKEIQDCLAECDSACERNNVASLHEHLSTLNELLVSSEGARTAARLQVGEHMQRYHATLQQQQHAAATLVTGGGGGGGEFEDEGPVLQGRDLFAATIGECAHAMEQVASVRVGRVHLLKSSAVEMLISFYQMLQQQVLFQGNASSGKGADGGGDALVLSSHAEEAAVHCLEALRALLRSDRRAADAAFEQQQLVATLCAGVGSNSSGYDSYYAAAQYSAAILAATCGCFAALATTSQRVELMLAEPSFLTLLQQLVNVHISGAAATTTTTTTTTRERKLAAMRALQELLESAAGASAAAGEEAGEGAALLAKELAAVGAVGALFTVLDDYGDDEELATQAAKTLALLGAARADYLRNGFADGDVRRPTQIAAAALAKQKNSEVAVAALLDVLNKLTTPADRHVLREIGVMELVAETVRLHHDSEVVTRLAGELFAKMGADAQIQSLMQQVCESAERAVASAAAAGGGGAQEQQQLQQNLQEVDALCAQLAMFLTAPLEDPADALQHTEKCLGALVGLLQLPAAAEKERLLGNVALLCRRLCDRAFDDSNDSYGAWAVTSTGMMQQLVNMLAAADVSGGAASQSSVASNTKFLGSAYRGLAACAANPHCLAATVEAAPSIMQQTYALLEMHKNDAETTSRILEFIRYLAEDPNACGLISQHMTGANGDIVALTMLLMQQHQSSDAVVVAGMELLGAYGQNLVQAGYEAHPGIASGSVLRDCDALAAASGSGERQLAHLHMVERLLLSGGYAAALAQDQQLKKLMEHLRSEDEKKRLKEDERARLYAAAARVLLAAATGGSTGVDELEKCGGFEALLQGLEEFPDDAQVLRDSLRAMQALAAVDANFAARCIKEAVPRLCVSGAATSAAVPASAILQSDAEAADACCDLLATLLATEGNGRQLLQVEGIEDVLLQSIDVCAGQLLSAASGGGESEEVTAAAAAGEQLQTKTAMIRQAMEDDQPREKTCKEVYEVLNARAAEGLSVAVAEVPVLQEEAEFLFSQMAAYNREKLNHATALGADHQYGSMALEILASHPANIRLLQENDFATTQLSLIRTQHDEEIVLYAVKALVAYCKHPIAAQEVARIQGCPAIAAAAVARVNASKAFSNERKDEHLCARFLLVERTAVNRNLYNKTKIMSELIQSWNDYDTGIYSNNLLRNVFRAMRRVVSDAHVEELLRANILQRLIGLIKDESTSIAVLPDVLFLLGSLGVVPEIKTKIGELQGVHACVELLHRQLAGNVPDAHAVLTNVCLAFANLCIGHKRNTDIFAKLGGPDLNVKVLMEKGQEYDVCNAASVLLCNLLYKNEAMKKYLGTNGAPAALVKALSNYDGSEEKAAIRCLESVSKAISNLSLYTANIQPFLDAQIEKAYSSWLSNLSETFPDATLETGCRTLANLVMENEANNMRKFGVCLLPCMRITRQNRSDSKALLLLLDIQASLCRLPENAKVFAENGGIETTVKLIHQFEYDVSLITLGVHLLGIQSTIKENIQRLIDADVFSILVGCVEVDAEGNEVTDLVVGGLRCTRRIIRDERLAMEYCNSGGLASLTNVIIKSINQPMVMLEGCRVLLGLLHHTTRSQAERQTATDELHARTRLEQGLPPDAVVEPDPEELANAAYGGWYTMGMDEAMIGAILQAVCACAAAESHAKQMRLQRVCLGLAAYFSSEQMGGESLVSSGIDQVLIQALTNLTGVASITQLCCVVINSLAMTSGDLYDGVKSKELMSALKSSIAKLPSKKAEEKAAKEMCQKTLDAMNSTADPFDAFSKTVTELDFRWTEYFVDPYPNGVHDLPTQVKELLRKGGRLKVFLKDKDREELLWRASQDLAAFEWSTGGELEFNNRIAIVRIKNVAKGLGHPALQAAAKKEPRKVTAKLTMCLYGPPNDDFPDGLEFPLKAKTQKERDQFVELCVMWRDAATYNF